jgi:ATP-binding cassette subfamily B protein
MTTRKYLLKLYRMYPWVGISTLGIQLLTGGALLGEGLLISLFIDILMRRTASYATIVLILLLFVLVRFGRVALLPLGILARTLLRYSAGTLLRRNVFAHILHRPGALALANSPGEAVSRFRDDIDEISRFLESGIQTVAVILTAGLALCIMIRLNFLAALLLFFPPVLVIALILAASAGLRGYRRQNREATGNVTRAIGEIFHMIQAIHVSCAQERVLKHFQQLNRVRRGIMVKERLFTSLITTTAGNIVNISLGLILFFMIPAIHNGTFTIGDFALFISYFTIILQIPQTIGAFFTLYKQVGISFERLVTLMQGVDARELVTPAPIYLRGNLPAIEQVTKGQADALQELKVCGLTYHYPDSCRGIEDITFTLPRGSFTVITGRIGAGKTTLLRVLLGLLPRGAGTVYWNGEVLPDPGKLLVPPRVAYTAQIPHLFSETLRENILLGLSEEEYDLEKAVRTAVMEKDLCELEQGLDTLIGPHGVKLSGGQILRTAAARMFLRDAELLVFDDLSSALDVETEKILWERLFLQGKTCLVVSHRSAALKRADHILLLKEGKILAEGTLSQLLQEHEEMRELWQEGFQQRA